MSSIDYESLLEFEESLSSSLSTNNSLLQYNLELKIDSNRTTNFDNDESDVDSEITGLNDTHHQIDSDKTGDQYLVDDLQKILDDYDFTKDEFTTCHNCGKSLEDPKSYKNCCQSFVTIQSVISSNLEKNYWLSFINNPSRTINTLPNYTEMLFLQQGIPPQLRSIIWRKLILIDCHHTKNNVPKTSKLIYNNFQHSYTASISKQISKDLSRTFPSVNFFKNESTIKSLSTILNVYANYDVELGYCQGLLFLVGALHYHFQDDSILTFHALCSIMESEYELHNIFTTSLMSTTLSKWINEFLDILQIIDIDLYNHLTPFVEFKVFLYQWWLSFVSSHTPDISIVNRIMDFCLIQGWKIGMFKISIGLLMVNKPILMSLKNGDEEVAYQHLLNDSKWGNIINDLDMFFGNLLLSWDDSIFLNLINNNNSLIKKNLIRKSNHNRSMSVIDKLKGLKISTSSTSSASSIIGRDRSNSNNSTQSEKQSQSQSNNLKSDSSLSVCSIKPSDNENESIFSNISSSSIDEFESPITASTNKSSNSFADFFKLSKYKSTSQYTPEDEEEEGIINDSTTDEHRTPHLPIIESHLNLNSNSNPHTILLNDSSVDSFNNDLNLIDDIQMLNNDHDNDLIFLENQNLKKLLKLSLSHITNNDELKLKINQAINC